MSHFFSFTFIMPFARICPRLCTNIRSLHMSRVKTEHQRKLLISAGVCTMCGVAISGKMLYDHYTGVKRSMPKLYVSNGLHAATSVNTVTSEENDKQPDVYQHARERRFHEFASVIVDGEKYMTAQDFLESVTEEEPRPRIGLRKIHKDDLRSILNRTPGRRQASSNLFRKIHENGIISYSEYLFLLCILTKPKAGFKIAFKMFDTDGNERVDKQEFLVLEEIFRNKTEKSTIVREDSNIVHGVDLSEILSSKDAAVHDTSLLVHFFGRKGDETLSFEDFYQFMDDLQTEVLEIEFLTYSHGMPTISEEDFAHVLLRFTDILDEEEYYRKLKVRMPEEKGLNFEEFRSFFQFLNNLEDFSISINMYAIAGKPIGEDEFHRAVKVTTGQDLSKHLVHTLYQLFDKDGDGKLSYSEFIGVMKDRLHRGFRFYDTHSSHVMKHVGWSGFKKCMKHNIKLSKAS
ncbi:calcium uptake protein 3, mitochondrial-like isoform X2 [Styela clava]